MVNNSRVDCDPKVSKVSQKTTVIASNCESLGRITSKEQLKEVSRKKDRNLMRKPPSLGELLDFEE